MIICVILHQDRDWVRWLVRRVSERQTDTSTESRSSSVMRKILLSTLLALSGMPVPAQTSNNTSIMNTTVLTLSQEWDKTFPQSQEVNHSKVTFTNRYGITLAADLYIPKDAHGRMAAIAVCGPFGACKEQCSGLYAQTLAERGFMAMAFDPSFRGE